jgi:hypothetical protein
MLILDFVDRLREDTIMKISNLPAQKELIGIAKALGICYVPAFLEGVDDGINQGPHPAIATFYDEPVAQLEYDTGCKVGACLALHRNVHTHANWPDHFGSEVNWHPPQWH